MKKKDLPILTPKSKFFNFNSVSLHRFKTFKSRVCIPKQHPGIQKNHNKHQERNIQIAETSLKLEKRIDKVTQRKQRIKPKPKLKKKKRK